MTHVDLPTMHIWLTEVLVRRPGIPPSQCRGLLIRVAPDGTEIPWESVGIWDEAQAGEGPLGSHVEVFLFRCRRDGNTLVVVRCPDGTWRERNHYESKPETPDGRVRAAATA